MNDNNIKPSPNWVVGGISVIFTWDMHCYFCQWPLTILFQTNVDETT